MAVAVFRRRLQTGPALRISPVPVGSLTLSTLLHAALIAGAVFAVNALDTAPQKVYVINLVPAIPAIGQPEGRGSTPAPPTPRRELPPPTPAVKELPVREAAPAPPRDMPPREMPPRTRDSIGLPDRTLPPRSAAPAPARPDQKELPSVAHSAPATTPAPAAATPPTTSAPAREAASAPPPPPAGLSTGSAHGKGKLSIEVDFPYAWYVKIIRDKIGERWDPVALKGQQPRVTFEIGRNGQVPVARISVKQTSGNRAYDQLAIRAIAEASPFPPLPDDFKNAVVTIDIQFLYEAERG